MLLIVVSLTKNLNYFYLKKLKKEKLNNFV